MRIYKWARAYNYVKLFLNWNQNERMVSLNAYMYILSTHIQEAWWFIKKLIISKTLCLPYPGDVQDLKDIELQYKWQKLWTQNNSLNGMWSSSELQNIRVVWNSPFMTLVWLWFYLGIKTSHNYSPDLDKCDVK